MTKLTYDPKSHFDPYKQDKDRRAHERGLERKILHANAGSHGFTSLASAQKHIKRKPVTLARVAWRSSEEEEGGRASLPRTNSPQTLSGAWGPAGFQNRKETTAK